jgi:hypothetical protein
VTAQGHARTQYRRAIEHRNLLGAEMALREMGQSTCSKTSTTSCCSPSSGRRRRCARHGRLETEAATLTLPESALAQAALIALCEGDRRRSG